MSIQKYQKHIYLKRSLNLKHYPPALSSTIYISQLHLIYPPNCSSLSHHTWHKQHQTLSSLSVCKRMYTIYKLVCADKKCIILVYVTPIVFTISKSIYTNPQTWHQRHHHHHHHLKSLCLREATKASSEVLCKLIRLRSVKQTSPPFALTSSVHKSWQIMRLCLSGKTYIA